MNPDAIYSSPYSRAVSTVAPLATRLKLDVITDERLRERLRSTVNVDDISDYVQRSFADADYRAVGGESLDDAARRGLAVLADVSDGGHQCAVIASHRNLISSILRSIDPGFGFPEWRRMTTPDVFEVQFQGHRPVGFKRVSDRRTRQERL